MIDPVQILWSPAGVNLSGLGARALVDITDGDTPNVRLPIRMLSIDTPEVTAKTPEGAARRDRALLDVAEWIASGAAPVSDGFAAYILPRLTTGRAATLQFEQGEKASAWFKARAEARLSREGDPDRNLFLRAPEQPFDNYNRLLAYVAPSYSAAERARMTRRERSTFNLDLVDSGWAMPFILFPNIPGERDLPIFLRAAVEAAEEGRGQYADPLFLPAWEYRMCEDLVAIKAKVDRGEDLSFPQKLGWRERYAADMRDRVLRGPESYMEIPIPYRIWIWPKDVQAAIGALNLVPAPDLTA